jgi:hypothetical protein
MKSLVLLFFISAGEFVMIFNILIIFQCFYSKIILKNPTPSAIFTTLSADDFFCSKNMKFDPNFATKCTLLFCAAGPLAKYQYDDDTVYCCCDQNVQITDENETTPKDEAAENVPKKSIKSGLKRFLVED